MNGIHQHHGWRSAGVIQFVENKEPLKNEAQWWPDSIRQTGLVLSGNALTPGTK